MRAYRLTGILAALALALGLTTVTLGAAARGRPAHSEGTDLVEASFPAGWRGGPERLMADESAPPPPAAEVPRSPAPRRWVGPVVSDRTPEPGLLGGGAALLPSAVTAGGDWDGGRVDHPRVISDSGQYLMWYSGFHLASGWQVGLAASNDGASWVKDAGNPVLGVGDPGDWDDVYRGQAALLAEGGLYKMWFSGGSSTVWQTGYATSTNGVDWEVYDSNPVLAAGGGGAWDEGEADGPTIINDSGTYKMWYHGCNGDYSQCAIGYATSADGIAWTKHPGNPVLTGTVGAWDEDFVFWPQVIKNGATYEMWYHANGQFGYATSSDGIAWTKYAGNPVMTEGFDGGGLRGLSIWLEGGLYQMWFGNVAGPVRTIGYAESANGITWTQPVSNPVLTPGAAGIVMDVNYAHEWAMAFTDPGATVTLTVSDGDGVKATVSGEADGSGEFRTWEWGWDPEQPSFEPGDVVTATNGTATTTVDPIGTIDGVLDVDNDTFSGTLNAAWFDPLTLTVRCEVWVENGPPGIEVSGVAADGGGFTCDFSDVGWDVERGQDVAVRYVEPDGDSVINIFYLYPLDLDLRVNYGHDWVEGNYESGHTLWITLTDGLGALKATATLTTGVVPWWGGGQGFTTDLYVVSGWSPRPDLQPGDWVYASMDNGYTAAVRLGTITGALDVNADTISGTVTAPWLPNPVDGRCEIWEPGGPGYDFTVNPNGGGYLCDASGEWDLTPGHDVAVSYIEPDGDQVFNIFEEPVPRVSIYTWADGQPAAGGNFVLTVQYHNDGGASAENVVITSTLTNAEYLGDTSPGAQAGSGSGPIVWDMGTLPAYSDGQFFLFVTVTGAETDTLAHDVEIATSNPYDDGDPASRTANWSGKIVANDTHLNVGKWPWTWDPLPGEDYVYTLNACNNGGTASTEVILTDTLPLSTTFDTWWGQHPGWIALPSGPGEVVLTRPSIPGNWCSQVYVRVHLDEDAQMDTQLVNTAVITASNDLETDDNTAQVEHYQSFARHNLWIDKNWGHGQLAPGGEANYWINFGNDGNVPATQTVRVTETIPTGLTFVDAVRENWFGQPSLVTPTLVTGSAVVWEFNELDNGYGDAIRVRFAIDPDLPSGTVITNCVTISDGIFEDNPYDQMDCVSETVYSGPNLRVVKTAHWQGEHGIQYDVSIANVGDTSYETVLITDTFPAALTLDGWGTGFWEEWSGGVAGNVLTLTLSRLEPGWTTNLNMWLSFDLPNGTLLTNTAQIMTPPGDANPADNTSVVMVGTGPDLSVEKTLTAGDPGVGELLTFTLRFANRWPWGTTGGVRITDTLPAGLAFVGAQQRLCGPTYFCDRAPDHVSGQAVAWDWNGSDPVDGGWWNDILVTVRVTDTFALGTVFTNTAAIASSAYAADKEPDYANNLAAAMIELIVNRLHLPVIMR